MDKNFPVKQTPYTYQEFHDAMKTAYYSELGSDCPDIMIKLCAAQSVVECGWNNYSIKQMGKSCFNYNVGNIKYTPNVINGNSIGYHMLSNVWEIINGKKVIFNPPDKMCWFRYYPTLLDGITDYMLLLKRRPVVWKVLHESQSPKDYVDALAAAHYFTADKTQYHNLLNSIYKSL